jgi:hypothetical protein
MLLYGEYGSDAVMVCSSKDDTVQYPEALGHLSNAHIIGILPFVK